MFTNKIKLFFFSFLFLFFSVGTPHLAYSQTAIKPNLSKQITNQINAGSDVAGLGKADPRSLVARVIQIFLSLIGITFTVLIVISGYNLLTAAGDEGKVEKAKKTITAAIIGLAITLGAYSLTTFLTKSAVQVTNEIPSNPVDNRVNFDQLKNDFFDTSNNVE